MPNNDGPFLILSRAAYTDSPPGPWYARLHGTKEGTLGHIHECQSTNFEQEVRAYRLADVLCLPYLKPKPVEIEFEEVESDAE